MFINKHTYIQKKNIIDKTISKKTKNKKENNKNYFQLVKFYNHKTTIVYLKEKYTKDMFSQVCDSLNFLIKSQQKEQSLIISSALYFINIP